MMETLEYPVKTGILSEEDFQETMRMILESVVSEGSGKNAAVEGYPDRWKDCNIPDTSKKCQPIYFFFSGICTGR